MVSPCVRNNSLVSDTLQGRSSAALRAVGNSLRVVRRADAPLIGPVLLRAEVANALSVAVRRARLTLAQAQQAAAFGDGLPIELDPQAADVGALLMAANTHGLTGYGAIYLQLAVARGADLLTADTALAHAARRAGVRVQGD